MGFESTEIQMPGVVQERDVAPAEVHVHAVAVVRERGELGEERLRAVLPPGGGWGGAGLGFLAVGTRRG